MHVWGLTPEEVESSVQGVSDSGYGGNVITDSPASRAGKTDRAPVHVTLRVQSSRELGAHRGPSGRRTVAACWHVHRDVMAALFFLGATRIKTAIADYRGAEDFDSIHGFTYYKNAGSMAHPQSYGALCECAERGAA